MSLGTDQIISLYQILNIPYSSTYTLHDGIGTADSYSSALETYNTIKTELDAFIAGLSSDVEIALIAQIEAWDEVSLKSVRMDAGGVTGINGVSIDYDRKRELIRERVENLVPYIARWRLALRQSSSGSGPMSVVMWN